MAALLTRDQKAAARDRVEWARGRSVSCTMFMTFAANQVTTGAPVYALFETWAYAIYGGEGSRASARNYVASSAGLSR
jgi:hypothetical protein